MINPATSSGLPSRPQDLRVEHFLRDRGDHLRADVAGRDSVDGHAPLGRLDNGPGIPAAERVKVLERFYRIAGSKEQGSGLGRAIVKEICARHGIDIALADAPGGDGGLSVELVWPSPNIAAP